MPFVTGTFAIVFMVLDLAMRPDPGSMRYYFTMPYLSSPTPLVDPRMDALEAKMQSAIPPGQPLLAVVDFSWMLDFRRNPIFNVDTVGAVSPDPGIPFFRGPEALKAYLKHQGIDYIAAVKFDVSVDFYNRDAWIKRESSSQGLERYQAAYFLDFMKNIDQLAGTNDVLFSARPLRVIKLQ
jgi:hypothetical protein